MAAIWVAMSGGVDSSVAAARLIEAGHDVTGVTMQLLPHGDDEGSCCSTDAVRCAKRVCHALGIPHYTLDMREPFERCVIEPFVDEYAAGRTPNPCIECNDRVKFSELLARACSAGADALATGHYARIECGADGSPWLARGVDAEKDQSYFLYRLTESQLRHVIFPVGDSIKEQIRAEADALGLPSADRPDSQEVCFVPGDAGSYVIDRVPRTGEPGEIVDGSGRVLGIHRGIARYTIGQRKGLGLAGGPWFVSALDVSGNRVVVASGAPCRVSEALLGRVVWRGSGSDLLLAQIRHRATPVPVRVFEHGEAQAKISFLEPVTGLAPGQAVVCYEGERVIGGGVVERVG